MKIVEYDVKITGIDENGDQHIIPIDEYFYKQIDEAVVEYEESLWLITQIGTVKH